ncbi:MAG: zinc ribbon domain-containing protein [Gammaproteobacteria bacterium]|nr:zinc ribbon domain-containing protein [Gammaproteobacteria bacterium]MDH5691604.1 zinc ribbon domain-containing protein [Gammaproteobacteria bacterium]
MPIYEYQCQECGHELEALQKISDEPLVECPNCRKAALKKLISAAGFRLKGSGWYETDFKGSKKKTSENNKKEGSSGSGESKKSSD